MYELHDKTLGIIGLGTIGKKVARLGRAFGMRVQYFDIARLSEGACLEGGMGLAAFDETGATDRRLEGIWAQKSGAKSTIYVSGVEGVVLRGE